MELILKKARTDKSLTAKRWGFMINLSDRQNSKLQVFLLGYRPDEYWEI